MFNSIVDLDQFSFNYFLRRSTIQNESFPRFKRLRDLQNAKTKTKRNLVSILKMYPTFYRQCEAVLVLFASFIAFRARCAPMCTHRFLFVCREVLFSFFFIIIFFSRFLVGIHIRFGVFEEFPNWILLTDIEFDVFSTQPIQFPSSVFFLSLRLEHTQQSRLADNEDDAEYRGAEHQQASEKERKKSLISFLNNFFLFAAFSSSFSAFSFQTSVRSAAIFRFGY